MQFRKEGWLGLLESFFLYIILLWLNSNRLELFVIEFYNVIYYFRIVLIILIVFIVIYYQYFHLIISFILNMINVVINVLILKYVEKLFFIDFNILVYIFIYFIAYLFLFLLYKFYYKKKCIWPSFLLFPWISFLLIPFSTKKEKHILKHLFYAAFSSFYKEKGEIKKSWIGTR